VPLTNSKPRQERALQRLSTRVRGGPGAEETAKERNNKGTKQHSPLGMVARSVTSLLTSAVCAQCQMVIGSCSIEHSNAEAQQSGHCRWVNSVSFFRERETWMSADQRIWFPILAPFPVQRLACFGLSMHSICFRLQDPQLTRIANLRFRLLRTLGLRQSSTV
jgi:hypothetical protein